ncbi:MAG: FAD-dependent oxidoreductase [Desulfomonilaceae bacterium]|jgi:NADPH-dependent 2,4-dienoyl-CoA reductase/sulfur reductase-like enzyme
MKFVVIGGDAAGMSAASKAKRNRPDLEVIALEATDDVSYSACGMPYNIADSARSMDDLVVRKADVFRSKQGIDLRTSHNALKINRTDKTVVYETSNAQTGEIKYDKLLIATGARPIWPEIPGIDLDGVLVLKSLQDGRAIKGFLNKTSARRVVIIGMGYIGLEMAEAFHSRGMSITMVKPAPRFLAFMPEEMAEIVKHELSDKGIECLPGVGIKSVDVDGSGLRVGTTSGDIPTDLVLVSVGVTPNSELASDAGLKLGPKKSIAVDRKLMTSDPDIFSAGDCADAFHIITGKRVWIPLALRANRAGWAVADNVTGGNVELPGIMGTAVFKVLDLEVARTGLSFEEASSGGYDVVQEMTKSRSRAHSHPGNQTIFINLVADRKTGKLLGASMVGKEGVAHRINSVAVALHAGMTVQEFFQCDMAYAPPFSPVWDPLLTAANQILKRL